MSRLQIFLKGNSDIADALFGCEDAHGAWGGLNEAFRTAGITQRVRVVHETAIRSAALLATSGAVPDALSHLDMAWPYSAESQFSNRIFETAADAFVLSLQADLNGKLARHRASGALFSPHTLKGDQAALRAWLRAECDVLGLMSADEAMVDLGNVIDRIRARSAAPILLFNLSESIPGDRSYSLGSLAETLPMRIKRFNLAAMELTRRPGVYIVDVNRIVAEHGAKVLKLDAVRVNSIGSRLLAEEVLRIFAETGLIAAPASGVANADV